MISHIDVSRIRRGRLDVAMPDAAATDVIAALLTFRLLYLIAPFVVSLGVVVVYENRRAFALLRKPRP